MTASRKKMLAFVPDVSEDDVIEGDVLIGDMLAQTHRCIECYDTFNEMDLKGNLDDCPSCKATEVITEI